MLNEIYFIFIQVSEGVTTWLISEAAKNASPSEIHQKAVSSMAEFTSVSMETFHRMAELLLIKKHHSTADEAESLTQLVFKFIFKIFSNSIVKISITLVHKILCLYTMD